MKLKKLSLLIILFFSCVFIQPVEADLNDTSAIDQRVQDFQMRYGIPLLYKDLNTATTAITFKPVSRKEYGLLNDYLMLFEKEIYQYPPIFFKKRQVRAVFLVTHLFSHKRPAQGAYSSEARVMIFDVSRFSKNKALTRHSIHHELFHMMAFQTPNYILDDPRWSQLNSSAFVYGKSMNDWTKVNPVNPQAPNQLGFVTDYAMSSVEEDKAEVFACLMQETHHNLITRWATKDGIMRQKIQAIKDFVSSDFPEMNAEKNFHD